MKLKGYNTRTGIENSLRDQDAAREIRDAYDQDEGVRDAIPGLMFEYCDNCLDVTAHGVASGECLICGELSHG